tara:strand:+ start:98747 stop:99292 length:546 start_codon:yes stop_codon:yes gene_type:complete
MKTYILLLRGINVSGQKKVKMADLKKMLEALNFEAIQTYIQSGNVVFKTNENSTDILEKKISKCIFETFEFEVPVLVIKSENFEGLIKNAPFINDEDAKLDNLYFVLLKNKPDAKLVELLASETYPNEQFIITDNCIYLICQRGYGNAKCDNNFFERKLKVQATTRNYKTMIKLMQMSKEV